MITKLIKPIILSLCLVFTISTSQSEHNFVDVNINEVSSDFAKKSNVSENEFYEIISIAQEVYDQIVEENNLKPLKISGNWNSTVVNAYMKEQLQINLVDVSGALARRDEITPEGLALIVCHEIGHAYGGKPEKRAPLFMASVEGQADYYGAGVCLEKVLEKIEPSNMLPTTDFIDQACSLKANPFMCERLLKAGQSAADLLANLKDQDRSDYATPDTTVVRKTLKSYPKRVQCRLDTYLNAVMKKERPRCWYKN
jgi:hypothetical protein